MPAKTILQAPIAPPHVSSVTVELLLEGTQIRCRALYNIHTMSGDLLVQGRPVEVMVPPVLEQGLQVLIQAAVDAANSQEGTA